MSSRRELIRWNDDLDKSILLFVQYVSQENGMRIPWEKVAEAMGPKFTQGAIVQHLAKLRSKMVDAQIPDIPVPPPLRKGVSTKAPSSIYATGSKKRKATDTVTAAADPTVTLATSRRINKRKAKNEDDGDDLGFAADIDGDADADYEENPKKKTKKTKQPKIKKEVDAGSPEATSDADIKTEEGSPAMNLRGSRPNYAETEGDDEIDEEADASGEEEEIDEKLLAQRKLARRGAIANGLPSPTEDQEDASLVVTTATAPTSGLPAAHAMTTQDSRLYGGYGNDMHHFGGNLVPLDPMAYPFWSHNNSMQAQRRHSDMPPPSSSMTSNLNDFSAGPFNPTSAYALPTATSQQMNQGYNYYNQSYTNPPRTSYGANMAAPSTPKTSTNNRTGNMQMDMMFSPPKPLSQQVSRNNSYSTMRTNSFVESPTESNGSSQMFAEPDNSALPSDDDIFSGFGNNFDEAYVAVAGAGTEPSDDFLKIEQSFEMPDWFHMDGGV